MATKENPMAPLTGFALRMHNVRVVHSRRGWTESEALKAVADAARGVEYPMEWANVDADTNRQALADA